MPAKLLGHFEADSEEWYAARQDRIGGSDIGPICGWSPYATREDIFTRKIEKQEKPEKLSKGKARGHWLEGSVLAWMQSKAKAGPLETGATYVDAERDWMLFNPDALTVVKDEPVIFEAKTTSFRDTDNGWGRAGTDKFPLAYQAQCVWGLGILGYKRAYLGVLGGSTNGRPDLDFALYKIDFDQSLFDKLVSKGQAFMEELNERKELMWA